MSKFRGDEILEGIRVSTTVDGLKYYVTICGDDEGPLTIDITLPDENKPDVQVRRSNSQAVAALAGLALAHGCDPEYLIATIVESCTTNKCEALIIADALAAYIG